MIVREATAADAQAMTALRAASIRDLCAADHGDDPSEIASWIGPDDKFAKLIAQPELSLIVVEIDDEIAGLGGMSGDQILLNYVHPAFRAKGVSKTVMQALESRMVAQGILVGHLCSTATALPFYLSLGWVNAGPADAQKGQPMTKDLL